MYASMKAYERQIMNILDTTLRIPPLFLMDQIIKWTFVCSSTPGFVNGNPLMAEDIISMSPKEEQIDMEAIIPLANFSDSDIVQDAEDMSKASMLPFLGKIVLFLTGQFLATVVFFLSWEKLIKIYMYLLSIAIVVLSYQANLSTGKIMTSEMGNSSNPPLLQSLLETNTSALHDMGGAALSVAFNYIFQLVLGALFTYLTPVKMNPILTIILMLNFVAPTLLLLLPIPSENLTSLPLFAALLPLCLVKYIFFSKMNASLAVLADGYKYATMVLRNYGLHNLLESEWQRLSVPNVLRGFWILRTIQHISTLTGEEFMHIEGTNVTSGSLGSEALYAMFKSVMVHGCDTSIALLGMTSIVSYITHYIGRLFQYIMMSEDDEERSMGPVSAILFFILAEQSGLTILDNEKRYVRLCRNFSFLVTGMLHFAHNMVNPVLMSLSASRNPALHRHVRALSMCSILLLCPCLLLAVLWHQYPLTTWLLAISAFSVQVIVKTIVSILIYSLFLLDAHTNTFWESLDDYVYIIRAFGNSVEFMFGILLFFTGAFIYCFESGGSIRAIMMCIHAYFNIWCEAKNGWSVFMKRRTAVNKINSLPEATQQQLDDHNDVCAICFQDLQNARITRCKHLFHSVCLRKWLYVQDSCPLCCETLYKTDNLQTQPQEQQPLDPDGNILWDQDEIEVILGEDMLPSDHSDSDSSEAPFVVASPNEPVEQKDDSEEESDVSPTVRHRSAVKS